jgi:hypothetical protein
LNNEAIKHLFFGWNEGSSSWSSIAVAQSLSGYCDQDGAHEERCSLSPKGKEPCCIISLYYRRYHRIIAISHIKKTKRPDHRDGGLPFSCSLISSWNKRRKDLKPDSRAGQICQCDRNPFVAFAWGLTHCCSPASSRSSLQGMPHA